MRFITATGLGLTLWAGSSLSFSASQPAFSQSDLNQQSNQQSSSASQSDAVSQNTITLEELRVLERTPSPPASPPSRDLVNRGIAAQNAGQYREAISIWQLILS